VVPPTGLPCLPAFEVDSAQRSVPLGQFFESIGTGFPLALINGFLLLMPLVPTGFEGLLVLLITPPLLGPVVVVLSP
jgi:hypothetical protein